MGPVMLNMYKNARANAAIMVISAVLLGGGIVLDRNQVTVDCPDFMRAMIPHHCAVVAFAEG